jgi:chromosome segregation ATPase
MSRSRHAVGVLIVAVFGLWGCSRAPSAGESATAEKLKAVEAKLARLEDDFRAAASARDQLSKRLIAAEEARVAAAREAKVKDEQLQARTAERDQAAGQFKALKDELKELLTKAENGMKEPSPTVPLIPTSNARPDLPTVPDAPQVRGK